MLSKTVRQTFPTMFVISGDKKEVAKYQLHKLFHGTISDTLTQKKSAPIQT